MSLPDSLAHHLATRFGDRFSRAAVLCEQHGKGEGFYPPAPPDAVVFAQSAEEVSAIVKACAAEGVPIIPFGAGTSLEGHVAALKGGVCVDLSLMTGIVSVAPEDMQATVEPGVTRKQLNAYLRDTGLFFPVDPGAESTLGGMAATRASGTSTVRYGSMRDNIVALEVVLADGSIIRTASRAAKSSAGYDLTRLFTGSEGTLGIITQLTLKLHGIPEAVTSAVAAFPSVAAAVETVTATLQAGLPLARVEFLDEAVMEAVNRFTGLSYRAAPTLFFELHGAPMAVQSQAEDLEAITLDLGGQDFRWTADAEEGNALWAARHKAFYAISSMHPGRQVLSMDSCVPRSRLSACILAAEADIAASSFRGGVVGHVGDGNFHVAVLVDPSDPEQMAEAESINDRITRRAIAAGGTCTGEHGIGYGRIDFLAEEMGGAVGVMRKIKQALDPQGLFNPGKLFRTP